MIVYGVWHGGSSYSNGSMPEDAERFTGIKQASEVLQEREGNGGHFRLATYYVHRANEGTYFPVVEGSSMDLYDSLDSGYPFMRLSIGPRGGVVRENY